MVEDIPSGSKHLVRLLKKLHSGDSMETLKVTRKHLTQPGAMDRIVRTVQHLRHRPVNQDSHILPLHTHSRSCQRGERGTRGWKRLL